MKRLFKTYIFPMGLAVLGALAVGCSKDPLDEPPVEPTPEEVKSSKYVSFSVTTGGESILQWIPEVRGRAVKPSITATYPDIIGTYGYNNLTSSVFNPDLGEIFANRSMYYRNSSEFDNYLTELNSDNDVDNNIDMNLFDEDDLWPYAQPVNWRANANYIFFSYAPYTATTFNTTYLGEGEAVSGLPRSFDGFNTFIWENIQRFSQYDHMISDRLLYYSSTYTNPHQPVKMVHIQARLRFCFKLGPEYSKQRIVKLRSMSLEELTGSTVRFQVRLDRAEAAADGADDAFIRRTWSPNADMFDYRVDLDNDRDVDGNPVTEVELNKTQYLPLASAYVFTGSRLGLTTVRVCYDVYDLDGNLIRQADHASNVIDLTSFEAEDNMTPGVRRLMPGYYYDINILIEPKYLHALSDTDADASGYIKIE